MSEAGSPEIASFHLNAAWCFANKRTKHISPGHSWTTLFLSKWSTVCSLQTGPIIGNMASCMHASWTFTKFVTVRSLYQKWGGMEWLSVDSIAEIFCYLTCYSKMLLKASLLTCNFFFQQDNAPMHLRSNVVQVLQCKTFELYPHRA